MGLVGIIGRLVGKEVGIGFWMVLNLGLRGVNIILKRLNSYFLGRVGEGDVGFIVKFVVFFFF